MLNIVTYLSVKMIKQKLHKFNPTQSLLIKDEIHKLLKAKFIKSIDYPKWVSNMVLVNHTNKNLCIYMDFHDLNKVYPKDDFPLPNIKILVNNMMSYEMLSVMDDFSSYNQI